MLKHLVAVLAIIFTVTWATAFGAEIQQKPGSNTSKTTSQAMTNADVISMVGAGLSEQIVVATIHGSTLRRFDLTPSGLIALKKAGVSDAVLAVMMNPDQAPTQSVVPPAFPALYSFAHTMGQGVITAPQLKGELPVKLYVFTREPEPGAPVPVGLNNRRDSVEDIVKGLNKRGNRKWVTVVGSAAEAEVTVEVLGRQPLTESRVASALSTGYKTIEAQLRTGDFSMPLTVTDYNVHWSMLADSIARAAVLWIQETHGR